MTKVALYARYSSDQQRDASIEDQLRLCREHAAREGWTVVESYADHAISGASLLRPGIQALISDATKQRFDIALTESLDRLSRDQEDIAGVFKRLSFAGVKIVTLSEGDVSELHIGLKGTMGALYLKDLADKTRRGLRGRVEQGKSGGGNSYGYDVVAGLDAAGRAVRGERRINEVEAGIIRRIFEEYAWGRSPRAIAHALNREGIPGPMRRAWNPSTIHGNPKRGTGILNNELYIGKLVWNRLRYVKDPDSGRRVSRPNPPERWVVREVRELRIVHQDLWDRVKVRQASQRLDVPDDVSNPLLEQRRARYLFSGMIKCGCCGGGMSVVSRTKLGCSTARNKGTCTNLLMIRRDEVEERVLRGLRQHLMEPALFKEFCDAFTQEMNRIRIEARAALEGKRTEVARIERDLKKLLQALKAGGSIEAIVEDMKQLESRKVDLQEELRTAEEPPALLHPNMALVYRERVERLHEALNQESTRAEATEIIRTLLEAIILRPEDEAYTIELKGSLAGILTLARSKRKPAAGGAGDGLELQVSLVAGVGFEPRAVAWLGEGPNRLWTPRAFRL